VAEPELGSRPSAAVHAVRVTARAARGAGRVAHRRVSAVRSRIRDGGADASGLAALIELHAVSAAGDAAVAVALAGTLFFSVPTEAARGRVLLYLLITMAPFAVVAPVIGPMLDRFRSGRRMALALTMMARGVLALVLGGAIATSAPFALYPAAFGVLVASKAYGVSRSAVMPRLTPAGTSLVQANARTTLASLLAAAVAAPVAAGLDHVVGVRWGLRFACAVYLLGVLMTFRLPPHADSPHGEWRLPAPGRPGSGRLTGLAPAVVGMLRSAATLRALSGFLLLFLAFLVREHGPSGLPATVGLGLLAAAATGGGLAGTALGTRRRRLRPQVLAASALAAAVAAALAATVFFDVVTVMLLVFVATAGQSLSKLGLDSVIQHDVAEAVRTATFGRTETFLQLSWVIGGLLGVVFPRNGLVVVALVGAALVIPLAAALSQLRAART
jgi:MFS family permease